MSVRNQDAKGNQGDSIVGIPNKTWINVYLLEYEKCINAQKYPTVTYFQKIIEFTVTFLKNILILHYILFVVVR